MWVGPQHAFLGEAIQAVSQASKHKSTLWKHPAALGGEHCARAVHSAVSTSARHCWWAPSVAPLPWANLTSCQQVTAARPRPLHQPPCPEPRLPPSLLLAVRSPGWARGLCPVRASICVGDTLLPLPGAQACSPSRGLMARPEFQAQSVPPSPQPRPLTLAPLKRSGGRSRGAEGLAPTEDCVDQRGFLWPRQLWLW